MQDNSVFDYTELTTTGSNTAALPTNFTDVWKAQPVANLNDCASAQGYWLIKLKKSTATGDNGAAYEAHVKGNDCNVLTPSFGKIGGGSAATID